MNNPFIASAACRLFAALLLTLALFGCAAMPHSGPDASRVESVTRAEKIEGLELRKVDAALARALKEYKKAKPFSDVFGNASPPNYTINPGDIIEISVWESPPSMLFGGMALNSKTGALATHAETLPVQMVMEDGKITMPFAGRIRVQGRSPHEIEKEIVQRVSGQANNPQVVVRVVQNNASTVTVLGDVNKSSLLPLTPKGERLLDALAACGGASQSISRMSVQLSRALTTAAMPLDDIIQDSRQNVPLRSGDVVTALYQPKSFSILGAVTKNEEIPFEAKGISLAQALARAGGLADTRADPGGVFVFRFEDAPLAADARTKTPVAANGAVPVIYQIDFNDPASFLVTQNFPIQDKDVIYVANMPSAELEKFLRMIGTVLGPGASWATSLNYWNTR